MSGIRINLYIPSEEELDKIDALIKLKKFYSRSEYIRTLIREDLKKHKI